MIEWQAHDTFDSRLSRLVSLARQLEGKTEPNAVVLLAKVKEEIVHERHRLGLPEHGRLPLAVLPVTDDGTDWPEWRGRG